ncbi:MAG: phosphonopyruvate decarboxylase [Selenomonas ruminantium]|jgi:phosphonopyruvate decarboxylase|uniref:Phosphonopyruvate decarboxylase n=1 Tax=Selenomonas ruminantium TaxID=971 RepID=A0A927WMK9_SELRU|nr:phosphonopyruvate decarboxylase [Selenomonas ruminantium]MBE6085518.1 phosphonopyruvate decarboxylase [Selenomonas ruminantium]
MQIQDFINILGAEFYTGVPDSLLRPLCDYLYTNYGLDNKHHVVAANEGNAAAIGAGYHLATGNVPVIYMQNSGEGNIINPLASLLSEDVYGIPAWFIIGWRGEPGIHDEPQHVQQGKVTLSLLETMGMPYVVVDKEMTIAELKKGIEPLQQSIKAGGQAALVIRKGALENEFKVKHNNANTLTREEIVQAVAKAAADSPIISTTGKASRELFEYRENTRQGHAYDFLTVGSMGHSSSIALGVAMQKEEQEVWCIDGDGAALMHMGAMAVIGCVHPKNLIHVIIDNAAHESVGGMPTAARKIDFKKIAEGCGYDKIYQVATEDELNIALTKLRQGNGLRLLIAKAAIGARVDLGRPTSTPKSNKVEFMKNL